MDDNDEAQDWLSQADVLQKKLRRKNTSEDSLANEKKHKTLESKLQALIDDKSAGHSRTIWQTK